MKEDTTIMNDIKKSVKDYCKENGMTLEDYFKLTNGVSHRTFQNILGGKVDPRLSNAEAVLRPAKKGLGVIDK